MSILIDKKYNLLQRNLLILYVNENCKPLTPVWLFSLVHKEDVSHEMPVYNMMLKLLVGWC